MPFSTTTNLNKSDACVPSIQPGRPILPSKGVRRAGSSGGGMGGTMLNPATWHILGYDSDIERRWVFQSWARCDVAHIQEQAIRTSYRDRFGNHAETVWDFLITLIDGTRELVSVKRLEVAENPAFAADFKRMVEGIPPGIADRACIATEWNLVPALVDRGELYMRALKLSAPVDAGAALKFVAAHKGPITVGAICKFLGSQTSNPSNPHHHFETLSDQFWTVVWLLAKRKLLPISQDYLSVASQVRAA